MFSIGFSLSRSIVINRPIHEVMEIVGDFTHWHKWSPWIIQEPDCPIEINGVANTVQHSQSWNGDRIGSGEITLTDKSPNQLSYDLTFFKPWKSRSQTQFQFKEVIDANSAEAAASGVPEENSISEPKTRVTWAMQGSLPFFMFFMKKTMTAMIGSDYARGLSMLKEFIETDDVLSRVDINGIQPQKGFHYVGFRHQCNVEDIKEVMGPVFQQLVDERLPLPDLMLTITHDFDHVTGNCDLTGAFAYHDKPNFDVPTNMVFGEYPEHQALEVEHTGRYSHLANAWATAKGYQHFAKLKSDTTIADYEVYRNTPQSVPEQELLTNIIVPIKC